MFTIDNYTDDDNNNNDGVYRSLSSVENRLNAFNVESRVPKKQELLQLGIQNPFTVSVLWDCKDSEMPPVYEKSGKILQTCEGKRVTSFGKIGRRVG